MKSLEENNSWISDGTYLAFRYFMEKIVPEFIEDGIDRRLKKIYIPLSYTETGVYIKEHYLGKINYPEFMSYIYALNSCTAFKLPVINNNFREFSLPFDLKKLILQKEDYNIYETGGSDVAISIFESFKNTILIDIIKNTVEGSYPIDEILDQDGVTPVSRIIHLSLDVRNNELFICGRSLGKVDIRGFVQFLTSLECYCGQYNSDEHFELAFDLDGLINFCYCNHEVTR